MRLHLLLAAMLPIALPTAAGAESAASLLGSTPRLPGDPCAATKEDAARYGATLREVRLRLEAEIDRRRSVARAAQQAQAPAVQAKLQADAGVPEAYRGKKKLTREERAAMAKEMLRQQGMDVSVEQLQAMKGRGADKAAQRRAMAEQMGAGMSADAAAHPEKHQPRAELGQRARQMDALTKGEQARMARLQAMWSRFEGDLKAFHAEAQADADRTLAPIRKELSRYDGEMTQAGEEKANRLQAQLVRAETAHCGRWGKKHVALLADFKGKLAAALPEYDRYDQDEARMAQLGTGQAPGEAHADVAALDALKSWLEPAGEAYRYAPKAR